MPRRARRNGASRVTSAPFTATDPARSGSNPSMARISVVLPMPLRPISPTASPGRTAKLDAVQHQPGAIAGLHAARFHHGGHASCPR